MIGRMNETDDKCIYVFGRNKLRKKIIYKIQA